uniref:40S ribosomal protein S13 n=1 Tax=Gasterosteus aculeatus aculeatus TaxID=481459 RepID=A0AAQ4Q062_GASAC
LDRWAFFSLLRKKRCWCAFFTRDEKGPVPVSSALQAQCSHCVILRDSHGVAQVRFVTGNKILRILKAKGLAPDLPEDLYHLIKKAVATTKYLERNRKDKDAKFRLILTESRIHRLARYYKTKSAGPQLEVVRISFWTNKRLKLEIVILSLFRLSSVFQIFKCKCLEI